MLVVREAPTVPDGAEEVGELLARRVEVEVAGLGVASVPEAVDHERRHPGEGPCPDRDSFVLAAEADRDLAPEHVEEVAVTAVDVQLGTLAVWPEARPGRVQRLVVGQDLHPPVGRVADDLPAAARSQGGLAHEPQYALRDPAHSAPRPPLA